MTRSRNEEEIKMTPNRSKLFLTPIESQDELHLQLLGGEEAVVVVDFSQTLAPSYFFIKASSILQNLGNGSDFGDFSQFYVFL